MNSALRAMHHGSASAIRRFSTMRMGSPSGMGRSNTMASTATRLQSRQVSMDIPKPPSALLGIWNTILKRNSTYVAYVVTGCVVLEVVYGGLTNGIWRAVNYGQLYEDIDWTKFVVEEEEEEEEEDE